MIHAFQQTGKTEVKTSNFFTCLGPFFAGTSISSYPSSVKHRSASGDRFSDLAMNKSNLMPRDGFFFLR